MGCFNLLAANATVVSLLRSVYSSVEDVDLLVGCLAEEPRPRGFGFGETAFTIFLQMASRRLMTDRFFQEAFTPDFYSQTGIYWINNATFNSVSALSGYYEFLPANAGIRKLLSSGWRAVTGTSKMERMSDVSSQTGNSVSALIRH